MQRLWSLFDYKLTLSLFITYREKEVLEGTRNL
jgi:hypothetical protein